MPATKLDFILSIYPTKVGWTREQIFKVIKLLKTGTIDYEKIAKAVDMKPGGVQVLIQELKRAAKQGYNLEKYLKAGRPLRNGAKVLAK